MRQPDQEIQLGFVKKLNKIHKHKCIEENVNFVCPYFDPVLYFFQNKSIFDKIYNKFGYYN